MTAPMPPPAKRTAPAKGTRPKRARLLGSLDRVDADGTLEGWCWSPAAPLAHRTVAITVDGHVVARAACNRPRPDLALAGRGEGDHGFLLRLPPGVARPGVRAEIALRDVATGQLVGKPVRTTWGDGAEARVAKPASRPPLSGNVDRVTRDGWVTGWCWDPQRPARRVGLDVLVDGARVGTTQAANWRADLQQAGIGDGSHGFSFALPYEVLARKGTLRISVCESGGGRVLGEPVLLRIGRPAESEQRVASLERQIRLLRAKLDEMERQAADQPAAEERAARALFATVAGFFRELADGTAEDARGFGLGRGLRATLDELGTRLPPLALRPAPRGADALVIVVATQPVEIVHRCLVDLHRAGVDTAGAEVLLLDPGEADARTALLPSLVRGLRYEHCGPAGLVAACNEAIRRARPSLVAFVDPRVGLAPAWLETMRATFAHEPGAGVIGGVVLRGDGLVQHGGLAMAAGGTLRDPAQFAEADGSEQRVLRPAEAVAALAAAARAAAVLEAGGLDEAYADVNHAMIALCAHMRAAGGTVLVQPAAAGLWNGPEADPASSTPDLTGEGEDARRLRLALLDAAQGAASGQRLFEGHALVVDDAVPRPDRDAGSVITLAQMRVLRGLGWRVTFAPASGAAVADTDRRALERLGIEVAVPPEHPSVAQYLRDHGPELDLVQVIRFGNAMTLGSAVRELAPRAKLLFQPADLHFLREAREAAVLGNRRDAPVRRRRRESELACVRAADATLMFSDHEHALLAAESDPAKLHVLRWIAEPEPPGPGFAARDGLLFMGGFAHRPNADAIRWYADAVLPLLRRARPGLVLHVVGADPPPEIAGLAGPDIEVHGWVPDLRPLLDRVRLSLAPLRYGAGFKGKVATSLAHGVPVVATLIAVEGTGLHDGDGVAVARAPEGFARAIARLHDDPAAWEALSARAVERVRALYSPEAAAGVFRRLLASLDLPFR